MYGKFFASTFTGSMYGSGSDVFALWGYVVANTVDSRVELNPAMLAPMLGTTVELIQSAIDALCAPDPRSRNKSSGGRRMVREGAFQYRVVNHEVYRSMRNEDERREYNRVKQQESRARRKVKAPVNDSQKMSAVSAQAEADTEEEAEGDPPPTPSGRRPDPFAQSFEQPREDVARIHAQWQRTFGLKNHALGGPSTVDYRCIADAIDTHGEPACLLVLRHARSDGMVSGKQDEKSLKHESIRYIFGNADAFARIHRDGAEREGRGRGGDALDVVARGKAL